MEGSVLGLMYQTPWLHHALMYGPRVADTLSLYRRLSLQAGDALAREEG